MDSFKKKITTNNLTETKKEAEKLARQLLKKKDQKTIILALTGELGSGKTSFVQGLAQGLGLKEKILSPTFVILKKFRLKGAIFNRFYHIDCYRLEENRDLEMIGLEKIFQEPENIVVIEWAEKIKKILPPGTIFISFKPKGREKRELVIVDKKRVLF
jgi:tRNA threonylcarbamoyladenosine biosynthesis protein TsaE